VFFCVSFSKLLFHFRFMLCCRFWRINMNITAAELVQKLVRRAADISGDSMETTHVPVPAVISGFHGLFRTRSLPESLLQTSYLLFSFNV